MTKSRKKVRNRKNHRKSSKVQIFKIVSGVFWKYFQIFLDLLDPLKEAKNHQNLIELEITIFLTVGRNAKIANFGRKKSKIVITGLIFIRLTPRGQQTH